MDATTYGKQALVGWRKTVGDRVSQQVALRTKFTADQVQGAVGLVFFLLSLKYVASTLQRMLRG